MIIVKPKLFPHWGTYAYTQRGFKTRVRKRLREKGFKVKEVERLELIYFTDGFEEHTDETGAYRNRRKNRLYRMSRKLCADRKRPLFELVRRSGLFYCLYDAEGRMVAFVSPAAYVQRGVIPWERL